MNTFSCTIKNYKIIEMIMLAHVDKHAIEIIGKSKMFDTYTCSINDKSFKQHIDTASSIGTVRSYYISSIKNGERCHLFVKNPIYRISEQMTV